MNTWQAITDDLRRRARREGQVDGIKHATKRRWDQWLADTMLVNARPTNPLTPEEAEEYIAGYAVAMLRKLREREGVQS